MKLFLFSPTGMGRAVLSLSLITACNTALAGDSPNLFQRLGEAISRAANRPPPGFEYRAFEPPPPPPGFEFRAYGPPPPPGVEYRGFDYPGNAPRRYQSSFQDARPIQRSRPPESMRYGESWHYDQEAPTRFDEANGRSSLRFPPVPVPSRTQYLVEPVVRPAPAPALAPAPDLTPPSTVQPTVKVPASPSTPQVAATPAPRPVVPFATSLGNGRVKMSFPPYTVVDVQGLASGTLAKDPTSGKTFRVP